MKSKILFGVSLLFGLMFINSGMNKIFNYMPVPADLPENLVNMTKSLMSLVWVIPLVAVVEIIGGILFITNKFRALGAIMIFPINVGILLTHTFQAPAILPMAIILMAINIWVIFENREKYFPMVK